MNRYEERLERRKQGLLNAAERADQDAESRLSTAKRMASVIPFGQPILVGHHSEKRDRNYRKRIDTNFRKGFEAHNKAKRLRGQAASVGTGGISSDDPDAIAKLKDKITRAENWQKLMKRVNAAIRAAKRKTKPDGFKKFNEVCDEYGLSQSARDKILTPDYAGRVGFPAYELKNNNANIRRMKGRVTVLERQATEQTTEKTVGDVEIVDDVEDNRIRLHFPGKPSAEFRRQLKRRGFRWSRYNEAWQRHRSPRATYYAEELAKAFPDLPPTRY